MNRYFALIAVAAVTASSGCTSLKTSGWLSSQATHVTQSQPAPQPQILRTSWQDDSYGDCSGCYGNSNECGCGCEPGCGCHNPGCCGCGTSQQGMVNGAVCGVLDGHYKDNRYDFTPGPPVAQTAYPYYTVHGPRDFLLNNPPSLGPY